MEPVADQDTVDAQCVFFAMHPVMFERLAEFEEFKDLEREGSDA